MKRCLVLVAFFAALAVVSYGQSAADHIKAGDDSYAQFDDQKALEHYEEALKLEPKNYEALWKASRAKVDIADVIPATTKDAKQRQMALYTDGTNYALRAVAVNPNDTWGHFQVAAALGKKLLMLGKKEQVDGSKQIKAEIDKAIALTPRMIWPTTPSDAGTGGWRRSAAPSASSAASCSAPSPKGRSRNQRST